MSVTEGVPPPDNLFPMVEHAGLNTFGVNEEDGPEAFPLSAPSQGIATTLISEVGEGEREFISSM